MRDGSVTMLTIKLPKPLAYQVPMLASPARFKQIVCGRRWGKTALGLIATIRGHGQERDQRRGAIAGGSIMWVAPTYKILTRRIWPDIKRATQSIWLNKSEEDHTVWLPGGGKVQVASADNPDSLVGDGFDGLILDEAARVRAEVWHIALRPTLSDRSGWAIFISTPNGRNWFYKQFVAAQNRDGWETWQRPTFDNPLIEQAELDEALTTIGPRAF